MALMINVDAPLSASTEDCQFVALSGTATVYNHYFFLKGGKNG